MRDGEARLRLAAVLGVLDEVLSFCVEVGPGRVVE